MAFERFKKFIGDDEDTPKEVQSNDDEYYVTKDGFKDMNASSKMILLEPRAFSEAQQIVDYLKQRTSVVVNMKRVTPDKAKRIVDFLSGAIYAIKGDLQKLGNGIFLCAPNNVSVEGKMSDSETKEKQAKKTDDGDNEYSW